MSCTPIREALNRLQQEGLIIYKNKVGAQVLTIEKHDVEAIQELAMTLHCAAIRMSMKRGNHELMLKELRKQRDAFAKAKRTRRRLRPSSSWSGYSIIIAGTNAWIIR